MFVLCWKHTRTGKDMKAEFKTLGQAWVKILMIRGIYPKHQFTINGESV